MTFGHELGHAQCGEDAAGQLEARRNLANGGGHPIDRPDEHRADAEAIERARRTAPDVETPVCRRYWRISSR